MIVVTATRLPEPAGQVPAAVTVIDAAQAEAEGVLSAGEALRREPALAIVAQGGPGAILGANLRGAYSSQVQVLVDGRPANNGLAPPDLAQIPLAGADRIEVVHGPASSLYGPNALGGVVNLITRRPPDEWETRLALTAGGFGERRISLSSGGPGGAARYLLTAAAQAFSGERPNSDSSASSLGGRVAWDVLGGEAEFAVRGAQSENGSPGSLLWGPLFTTPHARQSDRSLHLDLAYRGATPEDPSIRVYHSTNTLTYDDPASVPDPTHSRHTAWWNGVEGQGTLITGAHRVLLGGGFRADSAVSTDLSSQPSATSLGLFVEDQYQAGDKWSFTTGGRLDRHSIYGEVFSPRLGAVRRLGEDGRIWASVARAFRAPSFEDLYWQDPYMSGNPALRPEKATAYQAGVTWGAFDLTIFQHRVKDHIGWVTDPITWTSQAENLDAARIDGLDWSWRTGDGPLTAAVSGSWLRAVDAATGRRLPNRPGYRLGITLCRESIEGWTWDGSLRFAGSQYVDKLNTIQAPGYARLDLALSRDIGADATLRVKLDNALNSRYEEVPGYPMPGASLSASLLYRF